MAICNEVSKKTRKGWGGGGDPLSEFVLRHKLGLYALD